MKKLYFAAPLFTLAEKTFNALLAKRLQSRLSEITIILPQERAVKLLDQPDGMSLVYKDCIQMITEADMMLAILDGSDADSGTSLEMGYALALNKDILGVRTDFRISEDRGMNLMLSHSCRKLLVEPNISMDDLVEMIAVEIDLWLS